MLWTDEHMRCAVRHLPVSMRFKLAVGPIEDDEGGWNCRVCQVLMPVHAARGHGAWLDVLWYHDEASYDEDFEVRNGGDPWTDYMESLGLASVMTYSRCIKVYEAARASLVRPGVLSSDACGLPSA